MKKRLLLLLITMSSVFTSSQGKGFDWIIKIGGLGKNTPGQMVTDPSGDIYVAGAFIRTIWFANGDTLRSSDTSDASIFLAKFDSLGNCLWTEKLPMSDTAIGATSWISITKLKFNAVANRVYVLGNLNYNGPTFAYLAVVRANGALVGGSDAAAGDWNTDVAFDASGNEYLCGFTMNTVQSLYVSKFDTSGNPVWGYVSTDTNKAFNITVQGTNVYVAGEFRNPLHAPDTTGAAPMTLGGTPGFWHLFQIEYDLTGRLQGGYTGPSLVATVPPTPPVAGDFSASGKWNVSFQQATDSVKVVQYGLGFSSATPIATLHTSCADFSGIVNGNSTAESGIFSTYGFGCVGIEQQAYSYNGTTLEAATDTIPFATGSVSPIGVVPDATFCVSSTGDRYVTGEFTGTLSYSSSAGASLITSTAGSYDLYLGKYHTCQTYHPNITQSAGMLTANETALGIIFQWVLNGIPIAGAIGPTYVPTASGGYSVIVSDTWGCQSSSAVTNVILPSGIPTVSMSNVQVYPNPAEFEITVSGLPQNTPVEIDDIAGRTLILSIAKTNEAILNVSGLSQGIYILKTHFGSRKIVKE